jgi:catechol 2,3-dioxygenase-like lactoylglutathione lyase family enzyme
MAAGRSPERAMLDHATLRTHDLEGTRAYLEMVLDLKPGYRPDFSLPGYWLYAGGEPVVHLIPGDGGPVDRRGEAIDHIGFRLTGYETYRRKLDALHLAYSRMELPELGERRLFVRTPTGILLELVFREGEAADKTAMQDTQRSEHHA